MDALRARLSVCREQLASNTVFNTPARKKALKNEISEIEAKMSLALGLEDDLDESDSDSTFAKSEDKSSSATTPDSIKLESSTPPSSSSSGWTTPAKRMRIKEEESSYAPPIHKLHLNTNGAIDTKNTNVKSEASGSSVFTVPDDNEKNSVLSALAETGEVFDIDTLLKQQAEMEQRLADLKRRREEDTDESFARSIQEEEFRSSNKASSSSYTSPSFAPASSSSSDLSTVTKNALQSRLEKARQERMDEEMARLFAESDANTFNLTGSPTKIPDPVHRPTSTPASVYPIFNKQASWSSYSQPSIAPHTPGHPIMSAFGTNPFFATPGTSQHASMASQHANMVANARAFPQPGQAPAPGSSTTPTSSSTTPANNLLQSVATSIYDAAMEATRRVANSTIDLTKPLIDLTKNVVEVESSGDEDGHPTHYGYGYNYGNEYGFVDDEDDDSDGEGSGWLYDYYNQHYNQQYSSSHYGSSHYSQVRDFARNLTQDESEKELRDLLANIQSAEEEIPPKDRTGTPEGMSDDIVLLEHQKIGLTWLQKMEDGTNKGGILADDMGLGKTVQAMALIVSRPSDPITDDTKATLVVTPVALMYQWAEELRTKTRNGLLKVLVYYGSGKTKNPEDFRRYDVVITTFTTVSNEFATTKPGRPPKEIGTLFKARFHRVMLDEAQVIKNRDTKASIGCAAVSATYRWCLTGTPIQNSITELYSLIRYLNIKPYCDWDEFRSKIVNPMKRTEGYSKAMQRVQALMKAVCLRRTKTCKVDGKPILELPPRNVAKVSIPFSADEKAFYDALETRTRERFNAYVKAGTVMKNYSNVLVLLLRLRQACCHPHLIKDFEKVQDGSQESGGGKDRVKKILDGLVDSVRTRLLERGLDAVECPICMDIGEESVILSKCGHIYCRACITDHLQRHEGDDRKCPECRGVTSLEQLISVADFNARFNPKPPADPKGKGIAKDEATEDNKPLVEVPDALDDWMSSSKIDHMIEVIRDVKARREKVIVFSQFTSLLTLIENPLRAQGIKYLRYDGSMTPNARNEAVIKMNEDPRYSVMLISLKCGSLGLNMTVANHVVMMDPWWNPAIENQAIDRVHRIGQKREVFVHRLCIPETVEDRILDLQAKKQALADGALGEGDVPKLAKLGLQELMYLFRGN
ncbi:hypothetical protein MVEG_01540 [Podila verticillata NRRL 6337]|nr:hypothetical protein MVEG_01540 [Podila verticillata NRRL 6337]